MIYVIDEYIFERKNRKIIDRGSEKTCYDCGDYVLLETGAYNKETLEQKYKDTLDVKMILNNLDVNSVEIIDCKKEKNKLYILEKKIVGDYIQKKDSESCFGNYICDYICRLNNLSKKRILKKFVKDYFTIVDNGLFIDHGSVSNFLFDGNNIHFLDISKGSCCEKDKIFYYVFSKLIYFDFDSVDSIEFDFVFDIISSIINIYNKLIEVYKELGYSKDMYTNGVDISNSKFLEKKLELFVEKIGGKQKVL